MPRSVRLAIVVSSAFGLLGVLSVATWAIDVVTDGSATRWLSAALGARDSSIRMLFNPLYLPAFTIVPATMRRHARTRVLAFQFALLAALLLGFIAVAVSIVAALQRRIDAGFAATVFVFGLATLLAWLLSRPTSKAWFDVPRP